MNSINALLETTIRCRTAILSALKAVEALPEQDRWDCTQEINLLANQTWTRDNMNMISGVLTNILRAYGIVQETRITCVSCGESCWHLADVWGRGMCHNCAIEAGDPIDKGLLRVKGSLE